VLFGARQVLQDTADLDTVMVRPQVHLFTGEPRPAYAGTMIIRDFSPGDDAAWAVRGLGHPLAALPADRILMIWEQADLLAALGVPPLSMQHRALAILDATADDYTVTWYPFQVTAGPRSSPSGVRWSEPRTARRPTLPPPVIDVLDQWLEPAPDDFATIVSDLEQGGYKYLTAAPADEPPPVGEAVHEAVSVALDEGGPAAVERAYQALRDVLAAMPVHDLRRGQYLVDLCLVLQLRYEIIGDLNNVAEAVRAARDAASYPDLGMPSKRLDALGTALRVWYGQTGDAAALDEAIIAGRQAAELAPSGDENHGACLANLGQALHAAFMANGDDEVLDEALDLTRRAFATPGLAGSRREGAALQLGILLASKYGRTGELPVLAEAIELGRSSIAGSTASGWMLSARLVNLGRALSIWYRRTGELDSLREAAQAQLRALTVAPPGHQDRTLYQLNLSETLRTLFDRTGNPTLLDGAFAMARDALAAVPPGHPFRINHLANLALILQQRYAENDDLADLDAAEALLRDALAEADASHPQRPALSAALGEVMDLASRHTSDFSRLDEAIAVTADALHSTSSGQRARSVILRNLAGLHLTRHRHLADQAALPEAISLLREAAADRTAPVRARVEAARRWGRAAADAGLTETALEGLATAVELLPLLAARSFQRYDAEYWLSEYGGLASDAAALALAAGSPDRALELLELGRTVLIAQALDARTDLSALRDRDRELAARFAWLSAQLDDDQAGQPGSRRALADELEAVIAAARALPGLDRFLLPPSAAELLSQASQGPIAMINVSTYRGDALVLTTHGLRSLPLPLLTPGTLSDRTSRFLAALTECQSPVRKVRERGEQALTEVLSWLWTSICAPVLAAVDPAPGQRMWWIPTGPLGFLPLHAADGQAPGESTLSRVVSSYTPSVRALAHARTRAGSERSAQTLVVGMPCTPGEADLPDALLEAKLVSQRAPGARELIGPDATCAAVMAALPDSAWAHFACHAVTAPSPSDSQLLLHDHDQRQLTVSAVSRLRLDRAELAYLSACHTAVSAADLADEVIHIASAFHMAGFRQVIGTLWAVDDAAAATIAELVYTELTNGHPDPLRAPAALHNALTRIRENHPREPSLWASHIHIGI